MANRKKSPYQKYSKTPFRYSDQLRNLHKLIVGGANADTVEAARTAHNKYLRDTLGYRPTFKALERMKPHARDFWNRNEFDKAIAA